MDTDRSAGTGTMTSVQGITFRSDMTVELIKHAASDADVIWAARVSTKGEQSLADIDADPARSAGPDQLPDARPARDAVRALVDDVLRAARRSSCSASSCGTGRSAITRRAAATASSNPCSTGRGRTASLCRPASRARTCSSQGTAEQHALVTQTVEAVLSAGVRGLPGDAGGRGGPRGSPHRAAGRPVLLDVRHLQCPGADELPVFAGQAEDSTFPSFPQREIEMVAEQMESLWAKLMPLTHAAFERNGRVCP